MPTRNTKIQSSKHKSLQCVFFSIQFSNISYTSFPNSEISSVYTFKRKNDYITINIIKYLNQAKIIK